MSNPSCSTAQENLQVANYFLRNYVLRNYVQSVRSSNELQLSKADYTTKFNRKRILLGGRVNRSSLVWETRTPATAESVGSARRDCLYYGADVATSLDQHFYPSSSNYVLDIFEVRGMPCKASQFPEQRLTSVVFVTSC